MTESTGNKGNQIYRSTAVSPEETSYTIPLVVNCDKAIEMQYTDPGTLRLPVPRLPAEYRVRTDYRITRQVSIQRLKCVRDVSTDCRAVAGPFGPQ
jgi:hypothetical protein